MVDSTADKFRKLGDIGPIGKQPISPRPLHESTGKHPLKEPKPGQPQNVNYADRIEEIGLEPINIKRTPTSEE